MNTTALRSITVAITAFALNATAQNMNEVILPTGALPAGITKTLYQGASTVPFGATGQIQTNVRAISAKSTLADYWVVQYAASQTGFGLSPVKADVYPGVGVYFEEQGIFMKEVNTNGALKYGATALAWGKNTPKLTFSTPVTAYLETGSSVSMRAFLPGVSYFLKVTEASTKKVIYYQPGYAAGTHHWPVHILRSGNYSFQLVPVSGTQPVSAAVRFTHNNASTTKAVKNGQTFSVALAPESLGYAKLKISLKAGQKVKVNITKSNAVDILLIASDSTLVAAEGNLLTRSTLVLNPAPSTGDYYLVFRKPYSSSGAASTVQTNGILEVLN